MQSHLKAISVVSVLVLCSAGSALQAQSTKSADPAQPTTTTTISQPVPATPDEAATGRSTAPGQTGTAPGQAGTTPGQEQTTPGQASQSTPAVTGETPSAQTSPQSQTSPQAQSTAQSETPQLTPATRADLKTGLSVYDQSGEVVGKIESVSAKGAVISTGTARATIPTSSFARGDKGLVISMSKADINAAAKKKSPK